jgi:hypothetical protein
MNSISISLSVSIDPNADCWAALSDILGFSTTDFSGLRSPSAVASASAAGVLSSVDQIALASLWFGNGSGYGSGAADAGIGAGGTSGAGTSRGALSSLAVDLDPWRLPLPAAALCNLVREQNRTVDD